jgi:hypothetical protein
VYQIGFCLPAARAITLKVLPNGPENSPLTRAAASQWRQIPAQNAGRILAFMMQKSGLSVFYSTVALVISGIAGAVLPPAAHAWGNEGHRLINRLGASTLPADVPEFLRTQAAIDEIEYLGPEPDRWRSSAEPELAAAQAPEHFIDLELADKLGPLPHKRFDFLAEVYAAHQDPTKIGLQPWQADEVWERLKAAMRQYRDLKAAGKDTAPVEQAIIFYTAWLGHYVGDGSQPLHVTVEYNGWTGPNPNGYTTAHTIHSEFESAFVAANIHEADVAPKMTPVKAIEGDMFDAYVAYLRHTATYVEKVYQLEKEGGFVGAGTAESRDFTATRLAAGASMLRDMIYTAWIDSAEPVPDPYAGK